MYVYREELLKQVKNPSNGYVIAAPCISEHRDKKNRKGNQHLEK